jgi:hypothetical protein
MFVNYERLFPEAPAMRLPRVRFTVRTMMVAVAVAGVLSVAFRCWHLSEEYQRLAIEHDIRALLAGGCGSSASETGANRLLRVRYHESLRAKYHYAAGHPWITVEPDPPSPQ